MHGRIVTGRFRTELEEALLGELNAVRRTDPFGPIRVLVGSNLLGIYLKRRLAEASSGLFNVHFHTFVDLVAALGRGGGRVAGRRLHPAAGRVLASELLPRDVHETPFGELVGGGAADALQATFTDLAEGGCTAADAIRISGGIESSNALSKRVPWVLRMYARYRERIEERGGDTASRFAEAIDSPVSGMISHPLLVYGFYDFNALQWHLAEAIAGAAGAVFFVPWSDTEAYTFAGAFIDRLAGLGFEVSAAGAASGENTTMGCYEGGRGGGSMPPLSRDGDPGGCDGSGKPGDGDSGRRTLLVSAFDEEDEVRFIARSIVSLLEQKHMRLEDIAVLLPSFDRYGPLVDEVFGEAAIPCFVQNRSLAQSSNHARGVLRLIGLIGGRMKRQELVEFLLSTPLAVPGMGASARDPFSIWVRLGAETGMLGENGWVAETEALAERVEHAGKDDDEAAATAALLREAGNAIGRIEEAGRAIKGAGTWAGCTRLFLKLARELFVPSSELDILCDLIAGLADLDRISSEFSTHLFVRIAESTVLASTGKAGRFGRGVTVLPLGAARGMSFRTVFMPGLVESVFPGVVRQDPFLRDEERVSLGRAGGGALSLSQKAGRLGEEALLFALALESAREELVLSLPRFDASSGREEMHSSFLRFLSGYSADGDHGPGITPLRLGRLSAGCDPAPASIDEYDYAIACRYREDGGHLPDNRFFERGAGLVRARWGKTGFTSYDGVFTSEEARTELLGMLKERDWSFSPTSMETYAGCPFAYLVGSVLGAESPEEPERIITIQPRTRGILVHAALARIYSSLREAGLLPLERGAGDPVGRVARAEIAALLARFPGREPVGLPVFWEMEKRKIEEHIMRFLGEEMDGDDGFCPRHFERTFGGGKNDGRIALIIGGREIAFHGRIDRIDTGGEDGFRVIDYKTGRLEGADDDIAGGLFLQLPIYLLAASRLLERPVASGVSIYRRIGPPGGKCVVSYGGSAWLAQAGEIENVLDMITGGIAGGLFFAVPSRDGCKRCSVRTACPSGSERIFESKRDDERCGRFLAIRGFEEGEA